MGPLVSVLAAIVVHAAAQFGVGVQREVAGGWAFGLVLPYLLALLAMRSQALGQRRASRVWLLLTDASGWISYAVLTLGCGWLATVRRWTGASLDVDAWPDLALGVSFLPFAVYQVIAIDASVRAHSGIVATRRSMRSFQLRMFVACASPIALFLVISALLGRSEWLRVQVEHVGLASALFTLLMVVGLAWLLPAFLRWSWDTTPFPRGPVRDLLDLVARRARFEPRALRVWNTGELMANAAIVGFGRRGRTVLFSDNLLSVLNNRELCAVYAHEIGHARRRHVGIFIAWVAAFVLVGDVAVRRVLDVEGELLAATVAAGFFAAGVLGFGWLSRRYELDADLFAVEVLEDQPALVSALEQVGVHGRDRNGWRHFSVARRVDFLDRARTEPGFARSFRRRLALYAATGIALAGLGAALQTVDLVGALPGDRAVASLARGRYDRAATLARALEGEDADDILALASAGASVGGPGVEALTDGLRAALGAGQDERALRLARLARLRGVPAGRDVARALESAREDDDEGLERALGRLDPDWRTAVRAAVGPRRPGAPQE
ncbi:MAG: M48 family metallopeptidase [Planctomycetota bacterium]